MPDSMVCQSGRFKMYIYIIKRAYEEQSSAETVAKMGMATTARIGRGSAGRGVGLGCKAEKSSPQKARSGQNRHCKSRRVLGEEHMYAK